MDDSILVGLSFIVTGIYLTLFWKAPSVAILGVQSAWMMFTKALPWMSVSMLIAGLLERSVDKQSIFRLFGADSGIKGVLLAALLGSIGTGSRWGVYPLAAVMLASKASVPAVMAFTTSWMLISLPRVASEFPFFGVRLTLYRMLLSYGAALFVGILSLAIQKSL